MKIQAFLFIIDYKSLESSTFSFFLSPFSFLLFPSLVRRFELIKEPHIIFKV